MSGTLKRTVQDAFDEPACATNRAKSATARKAGCAKPLTPGAAAGGCAFDGAMITLQPIVDVAHLVHAPLACSGNSWDNRGSASSGPMLYKTGFTTDLTELDIVMGRGERKLYRAIGEIVEAHAPPAVFVYATCVTAMTGDDIAAVCKAAAQAFATPVIPVEVPGFAGSKNLGCKLGGEMMFRHVIGTREPAHTTDTDINIIGDYNLSGELWQVKPLLDRLGIRILGSLSADARYRQVAQMHRARVTMLVCSHALQGLARKLEETYGIPYFEGSFYGISDTSAALRNLCALLVERGASADLLDRCEALIAEEEAKVRAALEPYRARVTGKRVLLYTGGHKTWSIVSALQELGVEVVGTSVRKATDNDKARVVQVMGTEAHMYENMAPRDMYATLKASGADMLMSGARSQFVALKARTPWIDVNQEKHEPYAGYMGMVDLVRAIDRSVNNPMWAHLHRPAPWETTRPRVVRASVEDRARAADRPPGQDRRGSDDPADPSRDFEDC
ncbi:nitrogenase iron-molybdenum cofactor biosynthesis protein NifE [Rhodothalassium salexigens]|uniref:nitrogenase iron-molybdenum cofactor biosynthesis protein NifE n=1 Tax=Rhodothalassium salexigens TaxID=1086 RepID=UPI001912D401|nr:nitrogenase iron-molybdenum cofactor biosynthesis protein NifE [Rhodothalassium salexigens]MBK5909931.1 nitrogenase iron-molybdenum cofactor biosynthesis protein NifE [Rhodothalassium salexigens]MBK5920377.1 nitrogenase iron-molybdenum cofactor biosynthesis protein NifE [Rhodothalassium salexigens]